jgi:hypothetical protein
VVLIDVACVWAGRLACSGTVVWTETRVDRCEAGIDHRDGGRRMGLVAASDESGAVRSNGEELSRESLGFSVKPTARWPPSLVTADEAKYWLSVLPVDGYVS